MPQATTTSSCKRLQATIKREATGKQSHCYWSCMWYLTLTKCCNACRHCCGEEASCQNMSKTWHNESNASQNWPTCTSYLELPAASKQTLKADRRMMEKRLHASGKSSPVCCRYKQSATTRTATAAAGNRGAATSGGNSNDNIRHHDGRCHSIEDGHAVEA